MVCPDCDGWVQRGRRGRLHAAACDTCGGACRDHAWACQTNTRHATAAPRVPRARPANGRGLLLWRGMDGLGRLAAEHTQAAPIRPHTRATRQRPRAHGVGGIRRARSHHTVERLLREDQRQTRVGARHDVHATLATVRHIVGGECPAVANTPATVAEALRSVIGMIRVVNARGGVDQRSRNSSTWHAST